MKNLASSYASISKKLIFLLISALSLNGCIAISSTQSGRTVGKYNAEIGANATVGKYDQLSEALPEHNYIPIAEVNGTFGVLERLDIGAKVNTSTYISGNSKFQFLGNKSSLFAASIGVEGGFYFAAPMFGRLPYYISAPLFISVHPTKSLAFYFTPRYIFSGDYTFGHESNPARIGRHTTFTVMGSSYGLIIGQKHKVIIEASCFDTHFFTPSQFSVGYRYFIPYKELLPNGKLF